MKKKVWIIVISILLVIIIAAAVVVGILLHNKNKENEGEDSVGSTWGDTYYAYLTEAISEEDLTVAEERYGMKLDMENAKLQFCEVEQDQNPTMIMTYSKNNNSYVNVYQIDEDNKVIYVSYKQPTSVEYLYNIEKDEYLWYVHTYAENDDSYSSLKNVVENLKQNSKKSEESDDVNIAELDVDYTINKNEAEVSQETVDGNTLTYSKFDEIFVKPEITSNKQIDFNVDIKKDELKKSLSEAVSEYTGESTKLTDEIKAEVAKKVEEIKAKIEEVNTAKEELEKKKAEESKGLQVGKYTLKYGTYTSDIGESNLYGTIILNYGGTFHIKSNYDELSANERTAIDEDGKYEVLLNQSDGYEGTTNYIGFETNSGYKFRFEVTANNTLTDQYHGYYYGTTKRTYSSSSSESTTTTPSQNTSTSTSSTTSTNSNSSTTSSSSGKLTSFEYDTSANNQIATGTYYRGKDTGTESKLEIKSSTGNSFEFSIDAIYMLPAGYPNIGEVSGTAKAIKGGGYVYTEHEEGTYGWDYNIFFKISGSESNPTITIEDECYYNKYGLSSESPACGHNVTFDGTYSK